MNEEAAESSFLLSQHFYLPSRQLKTSLWSCGLGVSLISGSCAVSGVMGLGAAVGFGVSEWDAIVKLGDLNHL